MTFKLDINCTRYNVHRLYVFVEFKSNWSNRLETLEGQTQIQKTFDLFPS